jgi:hypothetical protein
MIYVLFKLLYVDRRGVIARRVAAEREAARAEAAGLIFVPARKNVPAQQEPENSLARASPTPLRENSFRATLSPRVSRNRTAAATCQSISP